MNVKWAGLELDGIISGSSPVADIEIRDLEPSVKTEVV
jgi:hypothetical protein